MQVRNIQFEYVRGNQNTKSTGQVWFANALNSMVKLQVRGSSPIGGKKMTI